MKNKSFQKHEVAEYERKRYRGLDQRFVHIREIKILESIFKEIQEDSLHVLDIPCGYGRFSDLCLKYGFSLVNSDISFHMVQRAVNRKRLNMEASVCGFISDAKQGIPVKTEIIPVVLSMRFFHHLHEADDRLFILKEFYRVSLKWVVLSYYQSHFLHRLQRKLRKAVKKGKTRIKMISRKEFHREITEAGFEVIKEYSLIPGLHAQHIVLLRKLKSESESLL